MKPLKTYIYFLIASCFLLSCSESRIIISDFSETQIGEHAGQELSKYLNQLYSDKTFGFKGNDNDADVQLMLTSQAESRGIDTKQVPQKAGGFSISQKEGKIYIIAPNTKGLVNGVYALLEKQGVGFYLTGDILPESTKWQGFEDWELTDEPTTGNSFVFNWHNFISGCTGWDLPEWQQWIDQANKMRYNAIMVHAYGNNPMAGFEYLEEKKEVGFMNNTSQGRDFGNQHINDVRRMIGGDVFEEAVFGAKVSKVENAKSEEEIKALMQQVFRYAEERGMEIIFALDFDTWMSSPQNIVKKLPKEAVFHWDNSWYDEYYKKKPNPFEEGFTKNWQNKNPNGYLSPNPDHPEGYAYYEHLLKSMLETYPEIDQFVVWHRGLGTNITPRTSLWLNFPYEKFPSEWQADYDGIMAEHDLPNDNRSTSMYAFSKIVKAIQKAAKKLKPELKIASGTWRFGAVQFADVFLPKEVAYMPLDYNRFLGEDNSNGFYEWSKGNELMETLRQTGKNRELLPIIWAHHDDHRYIGKPYTPWQNFSSLLKDRGADGFGIIHWTTRPLDLFFANSIKQTWQKSENESIETSITNYVRNMYGQPDPTLIKYYKEWLTNGPMFGRETQDHLLNLREHNDWENLESFDSMLVKTEKRLALLKQYEGLDTTNVHVKYQMGMEAFYLSMFTNQILMQKAYHLLEEAKVEEAVLVLNQVKPKETIQKYAKAIRHGGATKGEKAMVFSMNTRWYPDYLNLLQRAGLSPVNIRFSPTSHDVLAQAPGTNTYHIDEENQWWLCRWKHELEGYEFEEKEGVTGIIVENEIQIPLVSMQGDKLPKGKYKVTIEVSNSSPTTGLEAKLTNGHQSIIRDLTTKENFIIIEFQLNDEDAMQLNSLKPLVIKGLQIEKDRMVI